MRLGAANSSRAVAAGVLEKEIAVGNLILVSGAIRDEGVSYHYLPPAREVAADEAGMRALAQTMQQRGVPYHLRQDMDNRCPVP